MSIKTHVNAMMAITKQIESNANNARIQIAYSVILTEKIVKNARVLILLIKDFVCFHIGFIF